MAMIEHPPGSGRYVMIISRIVYEDLKWPIIPEDWARWDLEIEWDNMFYGGPPDE